MPDHVMDNRSAAGPSTGGMQGVMFGTNTDRERRQEYLAHFFRAIDSGIHKILGSGDTPLILAGVVSETAIYARENTYSRLFGDTIPRLAREALRRGVAAGRHQNREANLHPFAQ